MKRGYLYEKEMLHWLDGGEVEVRYRNEPWETFEGAFYCYEDWEYRIAEPAEKPKDERWLYVQRGSNGQLFLNEYEGYITPIGKIRMEEV